MYKESWVLIRKSDGTPHEFVRCFGCTPDEIRDWQEDTSDAFQIAIETVECYSSSVVQELAAKRIDIFFNTKFPYEAKMKHRNKKKRLKLRRAHNVHTRFFEEIEDINIEYTARRIELDEWQRTELYALDKRRACWVEGWEAFERGELLLSNPYDNDPKKMIESYNWLTGWEMARIENETG